MFSNPSLVICKHRSECSNSLCSHFSPHKPHTSPTSDSVCWDVYWDSCKYLKDRAVCLPLKDFICPVKVASSILNIPAETIWVAVQNGVIKGLKPTPPHLGTLVLLIEVITYYERISNDNS